MELTTEYISSIYLIKDMTLVNVFMTLYLNLLPKLHFSRCSINISIKYITVLPFNSSQFIWC